MELMNSDMSSVEAQLVSLYGEREHLERELGVSEAGAIVSMVRSLEAQLRDFYSEREQQSHHDGAPSGDASLEQQLVDLYGQRELLQRRMGCSDAGEILAMVGSLESQLQDLYREKESGAEQAAHVAAQIQGIARELSPGAGAELSFTCEPQGSRWQVTWKSV